MKTKPYVTRHTDGPLRYIETVPHAHEPAELLPLVVGLHGRGSNSDDLAGVASSIDFGSGYRFVFPDAPRKFSYGGYSWFDGWPANHDSLISSRTVLIEFIETLRNRYETPDGKLAILGFSQGGLMAIDAGFRLEKPPAAIIVMSGGIYEDDLPDVRSRKDQKTLIVHGLYDDVIPVNLARKARRILEEHGLEPEYEEFPMGHWVTAESMRRVGEFLKNNLG